MLQQNHVNRTKKLLENLEQILLEVYELEKVEEEYEVYQKKAEFVPISLILNLFISAIMLNLLGIKKVSGENLAFVTSYAIVFASTYIGINILKWYIKSNISKKNYKEIEKLEKLYNQKCDSLESNKTVPFKYCTSYAISYFIDYIKNKRANNISDAINIYENHLQHLEQMNTLQNIQYLQERNIQAVEDVNTTSILNSFMK